jgi:tetratricopeptide (TPR) repeat protein
MEAERKFREALVGLENLLPATHEDTNAVAYHLAAFYAQHGRMKEADGVLNRIGEQHLDRWGINHKKTRTHIHRVADLFHSWNRQSDAIAFLCRAFSYYDRLFGTSDRGGTSSGSIESNPSIVRTMPIQHLRIQSADPTDSNHESEGTNGKELEQPSTELAIKVEEADGPSLLSLIDQCEKYPEHLGEETLQAYRTVINCCRTQQNGHMLPVALERSAAAFWKIFDTYERKAKMVLDAAVELAKAHLVSGNDEIAEDMFHEIQEEAVKSLGSDDHTTIAILIDIGKLYQDQQRWPDALPWFEHALSASLTANGLESNLTKKLDAARENECYEISYPTCEAYEWSLRRNGLSHQINNCFPML